jgi:hypothetical protein
MIIMDVNIKSIDELGKIISRELSNNKELKDLSHILVQYNGNDWLDHIRIVDTYHRHTAYINDLIEIKIITWNFMQSSPIHDHPSKGCLLQLLNGTLVEELYNKNLNFIEDKTLKKNNISYMEGKDIIHRIINGNQISVSLHIYSPPNHKIEYYNKY